MKLTDEQIERIYHRYGGDMINCARAIERQVEAALTEKQYNAGVPQMHPIDDGSYKVEVHPAPETKQEPVAWVSRTGHGTYFRESLSPELEALEFGGNKMWTPLYTHPAPVNQQLLEKAKAVVDRWDTPLWKNVPATAVFINELRVAIAAAGEKT